MTISVNGSGTLGGVIAIPETVTLTGSAPSATTNFDTVTQSIQYYTSNASTNFTLNIRGNSTTTFNSVSSVNGSYTIILLVTNGVTAYYPNVIQIDGTTITPKWIGANPPSSGNASSIDVYTFTIMKTAATPTYVVLAAQTRYA